MPEINTTNYYVLGNPLVIVILRGAILRKKNVDDTSPGDSLSLSLFLSLYVLDGKTGLLTGLLTGKQGWKCPVALVATCCGSKSLKVILIDSDFRAYPVLNPLVTL